MAYSFEKEKKKVGITSQDMFCFQFSKAEYISTELYKTHNSNKDDNIKSYVLRYIKNTLNVCESINCIYQNTNDFISASTLLRSVIDRIAILFHIYTNDDMETTLLKHYLYLLDGVLYQGRTRIDLDKIVNSTLDDKEFDEFKKNYEIENAILEVQRKNIFKKINQLNIIKAGNVNKDIINKGNWKFKNIKNCSSFSWGELYSELGIHETFSKTASFISGHVHGLSISNIDNIDFSKHFITLFAIASSVLTKLNEFITLFYNEDIQKNNIDFCNSDISKVYANLTSNEYIKKINNKYRRNKIIF
ncbi:MAG: hypothetical protein IKU76_09070 [Bacteroidaceae bacterium]|nr:hypothetical protein [Bacteroidaceae bacterium]